MPDTLLKSAVHLRTARSAPHNFGLDAVRAAAILAVLFSHTTDWFLGAGRDTDIRAAYIGYTGVEVFFSLSGFLIGGVLLRAIDDGPGMLSLGRFWVRRWMRTLPAYWVLLLGMCWWFNTWTDWRSPIFLQNFVPRTTWVPLTPHTWSLVLEEWFYLLVPPLVLAIHHALRRRAPGYAVPVTCVVLVAACTAGRAAAQIWPAPGWAPGLWGLDPDTNPVLRLDCAAFGVWAAWLVRRTPGGQGVGRGAAWCLLGAGLLSLIGLGQFSYMTYYPERLVPWGYAHWHSAWTVSHASISEAAAMCAIIGLHRLAPVAQGVAAAAVRFTAGISYALYLVHVPVIFLARSSGLDGATGWWARTQVFLLIFVVAVIMRHGVERPILALRDRLTRG